MAAWAAGHQAFAGRNRRRRLLARRIALRTLVDDLRILIVLGNAVRVK